MPASGLTRQSKGARRVATPSKGLGLASRSASWASVQVIRWPAASTPRAGLGEQPPPPPPRFTPWPRLARPTAPRPTRGRAARRRRPRRSRSRERRPDSSLRCLHGSARGKERSSAGSWLQSSRMRGYRRQDGWRGGRGACSGIKRMGGRHNPRRPGGVDRSPGP